MRRYDKKSGIEGYDRGRGCEKIYAGKRGISICTIICSVAGGVLNMALVSLLLCSLNDRKKYGY